jgi:hypothetical protein
LLNSISRLTPSKDDLDAFFPHRPAALHGRWPATSPAVFCATAKRSMWMRSSGRRCNPLSLVVHLERSTNAPTWSMSSGVKGSKENAELCWSMRPLNEWQVACSCREHMNWIDNAVAVLQVFEFFLEHRQGGRAVAGRSAGNGCAARVPARSSD